MASRLDLGLNFRQALRLDPTDQPDDRASLGGNPFDAQSHGLRPGTMSTLLATGLLSAANEGKRQAIATCFSVK